MIIYSDPYHEGLTAAQWQAHVKAGWERTQAAEARLAEAERLLRDAREELFVYNYSSVMGVRPGSVVARVDAFLTGATDSAEPRESV